MRQLFTRIRLFVHPPPAVRDDRLTPAQHEKLKQNLRALLTSKKNLVEPG